MTSHLPVSRPPQAAAHPEGSDAERLWTMVVGAAGASRPPAWARDLVSLPQGEGHLATWVLRYLAVKLGGRSPHTVAARGRDLLAFSRYLAAAHGQKDIAAWMPAHTQLFLNGLSARGLAPTSVNRALWSLKHFAGWVSRQPGGIFSRWGHPAESAREIKVEEAPCKKLASHEARRLLDEADRRAAAGGHGALRRPRRDAAMVAVLLTCGLRVSELVGLRRAQFCDGDLVGVSRKGGTHSRLVLVPAATRRRIDAYLADEWPVDARTAASDEATALFLAARSGRPLDRARVGRILADVAQAAGRSEGAADAVKWHVHPHQLRHTFGATYRAASGSDTETAQALGHASLKYVGRYVRKSTQERRALLEAMFAPPPEDAPRPEPT